MSLPIERETTEVPTITKMRGEPTTGELQALAARQQQQLDTQARLIAAREHRLRQVKTPCDCVDEMAFLVSFSIRVARVYNIHRRK